MSAQEVNLEVRNKITLLVFNYTRDLTSPQIRRRVMDVADRQVWLQVVTEVGRVLVDQLEEKSL